MSVTSTPSAFPVQASSNGGNLPAGCDSGHVLVVGGTGMLRGLCLQLARLGWHVSVIARHHDRLRGLAADASRYPGAVHPHALDYRDSASLKRGIRSAERMFGPILVGVCWIHSTAPEALGIVADSVQRRLIQIWGSAGENPLWSFVAGRATHEGQPIHQAVVLGYYNESGVPRWLSHKEIVAGVLRAFDTDENPLIVGKIAPWCMRPRVDV